MSKVAEVVLLLAFSVVSLVVGFITATVSQNVGIALFFYLLSGCFLFATFRPRSL